MIIILTISNLTSTDISAGPRPGPTKASPSKKQSSPQPSSSAQAVSQNVRRSARTRNSKPNYAESSGGSSLGLSSRDASPAKSDAAWNESPGKSEGSSSPYRPTKNDRSHKKKVAAVSPISNPTHRQKSLSNKISEYGQSFERAESNTTVSMEAVTSQSDARPSGSTSTQPRALAGHKDDSSTPVEAFPGSMRNRFTGGYSGLNPTASTASGNDRMQDSSLQANQPEGLTLGIQTAPESYGNDRMQDSSLQANQPEGLTLGIQTAPESYGNATTNPMFYHGRNLSTPNSMAYPPLFRKPSQGEKLSPGSLQSTTQRYQRNFTEPANIFHRNYQQAMASHAALPSAFVGGNRFIGRSGPNNIIGTSGGDNSSMPLLTSSFNPNPNTQHDYTRMHRSFSSAADLTPESFPSAELDLHRFEPMKRTTPSAFPSMASFKRPRLDISGNYGAPALVPDRSRLCLGSPIDMPSTSAAGFYQGNQAFDDYPSQLSASASDLAAPSLAPNLQHPSSSYQTMHDPARNHACLTIPETTSQQVHELSRRDSHYEHFQDAGQNAQFDTKDPVSEPDWGFVDEENMV